MKDWGPKARASSKTAVDQLEKRKLNQNKRADKRRKRDFEQVPQLCTRYEFISIVNMIQKLVYKYDKMAIDAGVKRSSMYSK